VSASAKAIFPLRLGTFGLGARLGIIAICASTETLLLSFLIQQTPVMSSVGVAAWIHAAQHWVFRFVIAYAVACLMLFSLARPGTISSIGRQYADAPVRPAWLIAHGLCLAPFALLSTLLYSDAGRAHFLPLAIAWHAAGVAALTSLFAGLAPWSVWARAFARSRATLLYAIAPALGTVLAIQWSQALWHPAAGLTFRLSAALLRPFLGNLQLDFAQLNLSTGSFAVNIADECSGLEGMGLMLVFCVSWLWFFRREYYFPRALLIIPAALAFIFLLNSVRIAALVLIGDAGYPRIAVVGFHSQAGWIAFNTAAFLVAMVAKRSPWLNRTAARPLPGAATGAVTDNPTAPYLMPLLVILAAGMLAHAASAGFDWLYGLRLLGGAAMLWIYRRSLRALDWRFSWRGILIGIGACGLWIAFDHWEDAVQTMPDALAAVSAPTRGVWILIRALAAVVTVPIAEELAYRGFLMRRIVASEFDQVGFAQVGWLGLIGSAVIFGLSHGHFWLPGIVVGLGFGWITMRTGKLGEAVIAHAAANAGIAAYVLLFDQWQLW
jgi:exosortase E/protease (VPEID-CTERM system)